MGIKNHYVPQEYLRGFCKEPSSIWTYDKLNRRWFCPSVANIAAERGFYPDDVEKALNELVEGPANHVIQKLRRNENITDTERQTLSKYIGVMLHRVPANRERGYELAPKVLESTVKEVKDAIRSLGENGLRSSEWVERYTTEADAVHEKLRSNPPESVVEQINSPWASDDIVELIASMAWRVLRSRGPTYFLTTDNPVFFFQAFGLGRQESELCLPLSTDLALICNRQGTHKLRSVKERQEFVKEINRRLASEATRFLFYHERASWVETLAHRTHPHLSQLVWERKV